DAAGRRCRIRRTTVARAGTPIHRPQTHKRSGAGPNAGRQHRESEAAARGDGRRNDPGHVADDAWRPGATRDSTNCHAAGDHAESLVSPSRTTERLLARARCASAIDLWPERRRESIRLIAGGNIAPEHGSNCVHSSRAALHLALACNRIALASAAALGGAIAVTTRRIGRLVD